MALVAAEGIVKIYPDGTEALRGVSLEIRSGEILGLLGENGAGKTTLMKIVSGLLSPTHGRIRLDGNVVHFKMPAQALKAGIGMVHQHIPLVHNFTGFENIILGLGRIDFEKARKKLAELMEETGLKVNLDVPVENLSLGERQRIEILKMLFRGVKVLILDEPTTNLTPIETKELFVLLKKLAKEGKAIVFISHKIKEVMSVTDRVVVLRKGKVVGELLTRETTPQELASLMVGRQVVFRYLPKERYPRQEDLLVVKDLWVKDDFKKDAVKGISFELRSGEILGVAGVEGNGQRELVEALTGLRKVHKGKVFLRGEEVTNLSPDKLSFKGLVHIPEDRRNFGLVMEMNFLENVLLGLHRYRDFLIAGQIINWSKVSEHAKELIEKYEMVVASVKSPVRSLSGGNQQKLIVARELSKNPSVIIAANPTRGLDVASTQFVRNKLIELRNRGIGVLLVSSDLDEVLDLSDRIAVIYEGRFLALKPTKEYTLKEIGLLMGGVEE